MVDTLGLVWGLAVLPADVQDRDGAKHLLAELPDLPRLAVVWADGAYQSLVDWVGQTFGWAAEFLNLAATGALSITVGDARVGR